MPRLTWVGKDKVENHHHDVPFRLLERQYVYASPFPASGGRANSTGNKIIHGDNLEALKALLPEYEGRVKCIYIDPPYNTGNEGWVYNDNVNDPKIRRWLGQVVGKEGEDLSRHDKWLCMMYPRLKLLHRLLAEDGFILVSIDHFEIHHLRVLLDEIFGSQNHRNTIAVRRGIKNVQSQFEDVQALAVGHEYLLLYSKRQGARLPKLAHKLEQANAGKWDTFWRGTDRPTMRYPLLGLTPDRGQWRWEESRARRAVENYQQYLRIQQDAGISLDDYYASHLQATNEGLDFVRLSDDGVVQYYVAPRDFRLMSDNWMDLTLSGSETSFDTEKSIGVIERILGWMTPHGTELVLDSFAGSGTTAHAVLKLNAQDGGNRRFILVEMMDYAETITAERVRRAMAGYGEGTRAVAGLGGGFEYCTIGPALFGDDGNLNEVAGVAAIRNYVAYTEGLSAEERSGADNSVSPYFLGRANETDYFFYYEPERVTTLDYAFLGTLKGKPVSAVIYADACALSAEFMRSHGLIFKKIPRDISRF